MRPLGKQRAPEDACTVAPGSFFNGTFLLDISDRSTNETTRRRDSIGTGTRHEGRRKQLADWTG